MTDEELAAWDAKQREFLTSPQTLASFLRAPTVGKKVAEKKFDTSEYT